MDVDRNTAAIVFYGHNIVSVQTYIDGFAMSGQRFIDAVVYNFVHQVVKSTATG